MTISNFEFRVAMETYKAKKIDYSIKPCYDIAGVKFLKKFENCVSLLPYGNKELISHSITETRKIFPSHIKGHFIFSIKALFTLATLIDGVYSEENVNGLTNKTYKKAIKIIESINMTNSPYRNSLNLKMIELYNLLDQYKSIVNPFLKSRNLKDPIMYLDKFDDFYIEKFMLRNGFEVCMTSGSYSSIFYVIKDELSLVTTMYDTIIPKASGYINIHYIYVDSPKKKDEIVSFHYKANKSISSLNDIHWTFSLKAVEEESRPLNEKQLKTIIVALKETIIVLENELLSKMLV